VGTAKRERQKANRQLKREQELQAMRTAKTKRWGLRIGIAVAAALGLMFLAAQLWGGDDDAPTPATSTLVPVDPSLLPPVSTLPGDTVPGSTVPASTVPASSVPDSSVPETTVSEASTTTSG
jgi:hypothetical protein